MHAKICSLLFCATLVGAAPASAVTVTLTPLQDTTIYSEGGAFGNGAGDVLTVGRLGSTGENARRRGIVAFDVGSLIPAGATVESVTLELQLIQAAPGSSQSAVSLHRATRSWGEGTGATSVGQAVTAGPGDATWTDAFLGGETWASAGGDWTASASSTRLVGSAFGVVAWPSTPQLVADVQGWLAAPSSNHGWFLIADESVVQNARNYRSREAVTPEHRPRLVVTFTAVPEPSGLALAGVILGGIYSRRRR